MPIPGRFFFALLFIAVAVVCYIVARKLKASRTSDAPTEPEYEETPDGADWHVVDRIERRNDDKRAQYQRDLAAYEKTDPTTRWTRWVAHASLIFGVFLFVLSCFTVVGTKQVGIVTSFGRPVDSIGSGIHFKMPWQKVPEIDGAIQTDNFVGQEGCINVRMAGDTTGCIDATVRWRIPEKDSEDVYQDYRDIDRIRDSVVVRDLQSVLNEEFGDFDPLAALANLAEETESGDVNVSSTINLGERAESVTDRMVEIAGDRVQIQENGITIPFIRYDDRTQGRINSLLEEIANTRVERQREQTNIATADANRALADSISRDPNVLVSRCLDIWEMYAEAEIPLPAGSSCWQGGQSAVVVPSAPQPSG